MSNANTAARHAVTVGPWFISYGSTYRTFSTFEAFQAGYAAACKLVGFGLVETGREYHRVAS